MDPELMRILMDPAAGELAGGGGGASTQEPTSDAGATRDPQLTAEQLAEPPDFNDGRTPAEPGTAAKAGAGAGVDASRATPADPNLAASVARGTQITQAQPTIRDFLGRLGYTHAASFQDDTQALFHLVQQAQLAQRNDYYAQLGQAIAPHAPQVQEFLAQQRQAAQAQEQAPPAWQPPEFDERWLQLVERDERGVWKAVPGVNPIVAEKVQAYSDWLAKFQRNPLEVLNPMVEARAQQIVNQALDQRFQQYQQQTVAQQIVEANANWLYATDQHGNRLVGQDGRFIPTPEGARYHQHIRTLQAGGMSDPRQLDAIARQLVHGEILAQRATTGQQTNAAQTPPATAALGRPNVNPGQAVPPSRQGAVAGATQPSTEGRSLKELLQEAFDAEGVTDAEVAASLSG